MIPANPFVFLKVAVLIFVSLILLVWALSEERKQAKTPHPEILWRCTTCSFIYNDPRTEDLSRCPRCRSINKRAEATMPSSSGRS